MQHHTTPKTLGSKWRLKLIGSLKVWSFFLQNLKIVLGNFLGTEETSSMNWNFRGKFSKNLFESLGKVPWENRRWNSLERWSSLKDPRRNLGKLLADLPTVPASRYAFQARKIGVQSCSSCKGIWRNNKCNAQQSLPPSALVINILQKAWFRTGRTGSVHFGTVTMWCDPSPQPHHWTWPQNTATLVPWSPGHGYPSGASWRFEGPEFAASELVWLGREAGRKHNSNSPTSLLLPILI